MPILTTAERIGTLLAGKYKLERVIGEGGMGVVFEALHTWTNRPCAVKLLHPGHARELDIARRFLQEARTAAAVRHPNIVDVLDMGSEEDGTVYLVLELLKGQSLSRMLERGALGVEETLRIMLPAMGAIAAAHDKGIIHRDLKPENFFLHREGGETVTKVLDFGLAKAIDAGSGTQTSAGLVLGTPFYVAPEQAAGEPDIGPQVDVWAMGVVLYQCLSGRVPFGGDTPTAVILKVCTTEPAPLDEVAPLVPSQFVSVVHNALVKDRSVRYANMRELGNAMIDAARAARVPIITPKGLGKSVAALRRRPDTVGGSAFDDEEDTASTPMPTYDSVEEPQTLADSGQPAQLVQSGPLPPLATIVENDPFAIEDTRADVAKPPAKGLPMIAIAGVALLFFVLVGVGVGAGIVIATSDDAQLRVREERRAASPAPDGEAPSTPTPAEVAPEAAQVPSTPETDEGPRRRRRPRGRNPGPQIRKLGGQTQAPPISSQW